MRVLKKLLKQYLKTVEDEYGLNTEKAQYLYQYLWIFTHGIASLYATGVYSLKNEEVSCMMKDVCIGVLTELKRNKKKK